MRSGLKAKKGASFIINTVLFQKYHVLSLLGSGGSSSVYLAEHLKLKHHRAIKCIPKTQARTASRYLEAGLLKNLRHPGIPVIYDIEEDESHVYIIEEYIQGESLSAYVQNHNNISQETIAAFGIQLCGIIEYLHNQKPYPILYLDLKPEHIILCGTQLKLIDFGISAAKDGEIHASNSWGTPGFAAPEQFTGCGLGTKTDVFGIGAVLYYMLTREILPPHSGIPGFFPKYCSHSFKKIITKAAAPRPEKRYDNVKQLQEALQKLSLSRTGTDPSAHLLEQITVVGSQAHIGTTHIAVSLTSWFNQRGMEACYGAKNRGTEFFSSLQSYQEGLNQEGGRISYGNFQAVLSPKDRTGTGKPHIFVQDFGNDTVSAAEEEQAGLTVLVIGSRPWEMEHGILAYKQLAGEENLVLICNYKNKKSAEKYAKILRKNVYCFPLDRDPFSVTKEKHRLFQKILREGRG